MTVNGKIWSTIICLLFLELYHARQQLMECVAELIKPSCPKQASWRLPYKRGKVEVLNTTLFSFWEQNYTTRQWDNDTKQQSLVEAFAESFWWMEQIKAIDNHWTSLSEKNYSTLLFRHQLELTTPGIGLRRKKKIICIHLQSSVNPFHPRNSIEKWGQNCNYNLQVAITTVQNST